MAKPLSQSRGYGMVHKEKKHQVHRPKNMKYKTKCDGNKQRKEMLMEKIKIDMSECEYHSDHGRSYYVVKCPYCGQYNACYAWSVSANGKRCEDCKSLITLKAGKFTVTKYEKPVVLPKSKPIIISSSSQKGIGETAVDLMAQAEKDGFETVYNEAK